MTGPRLSNATQAFAASATVRMTAIQEAATVGKWIGSICAGAVSVAIGAGVLKYLAGDNVPLQYFGGIVIAFGLNVASRGMLLHFALAAKDGLLAWKGGRTEKPDQSEDVHP